MRNNLLVGIAMIIAGCAMAWSQQSSTAAQQAGAAAQQQPGAAPPPATGAQPPAATVQPSKPRQFALIPDQIVRTQEKSDVDVAIEDESCSLKGATLEAFTGFGLAVSHADSTNACLLAATLTINPSTRLGKAPFWVKRNNVVLGKAELTILSQLPGPIPPGLEPQVDLMWSVLPASIVYNNYGHWVANNFYGIELVVGNNTGYDLQIAGVGFKVDGSLPSKVPTSGYRTVRGELERGQQFGPRNVIYRSIQAAGLLLTGGTPYFRAARAQANYAHATNIFSNALEKGFALVIPDITVPELDRLDQNTLRDSLVIPNNTQMRTSVFVPRDILRYQYCPLTDNAADKACLKKLKKYDPLDVMKKLGQLVLVGDPIYHLNRIRVVSNPETTTKAEPVIDQNRFPAEKGGTATISGTNLAKARVSGIGIAVTVVSQGDTSIKVNMAPVEKPGRYSLTLDVPGQATQKAIPIEMYPPVSVDPDKLDFGQQKEQTKSDAQTVTIFNESDQEVKSITFAASEGFAAVSLCGNSLASGGKCSIAVTFSPTKAAAIAGKLTIHYTRSGSESKEVVLSGTGTSNK